MTPAVKHTPATQKLWGCGRNAVNPREESRKIANKHIRNVNGKRVGIYTLATIREM